MRATTEFSLASLRLNPCADGASIPPPLAHASKPTREEQHGQGSDAQHQGKEEAEGGVEQEEERRPHPLAVRVGTGARPAVPESVRQEELAERPIDGAALHPFPFEEARSVKAGGHRARATPQQSSGLLLSDAGMFSTSGDSRDRPDRPTSPNPCGCRGRGVRDRAPGYTLKCIHTARRACANARAGSAKAACARARSSRSCWRTATADRQGWSQTVFPLGSLRVPQLQSALMSSSNRPQDAHLMTNDR